MQVKKWSGQDTEDVFNYHIKKFPKLFYHYQLKELTYQINDAGYRSTFEFLDSKVKGRELRGKSVDIYLGCSHTYGVGHFWENTFPFIVAKSTGNEIMNLGKGGYGVEHSFYSLLNYIDFFNVHNVFHFQPVYPRYDYMGSISPVNPKVGKKQTHTKELFFPFQPQHYWNNDNQSPYKDKYIAETLITPEYMYYNHAKHVYAIQGLCKSKHIKYYHTFSHPKPSKGICKTYKFDDLYKGKPRSPRVLVKQLVKNSKVENKVTLGGRIPARDGLHMTVHEQKLIGNNFLYLKDRYPNGYIQEIPYKQEFLEKIFPRSVGK